MRRIQEVALGLFDAHGFDNVTVEQVADAAMVSPSSVYRYFGTKEMLVLYDDLDVDFIDRIKSELVDHPPTDAVRRALVGVMANFFDRDEALARRKARYAMSDPSLQAGQRELLEHLAQQVAEGLARATERTPDALEVQVTATALVWSLGAAVRHWHAGGYRTRLQDELEEAVEILERGLR